MMAVAEHKQAAEGRMTAEVERSLVAAERNLVAVGHRMAEEERWPGGESKFGGALPCGA